MHRGWLWVCLWLGPSLGHEVLTFALFPLTTPDCNSPTCRETHPDVTGSADSAIEFLEVQNAYSLLMDPAKRAKYDSRLRPKSKTVLTYLNTRAAVRSGFQPSSQGSGVIDEELRLELYSTMRDLLRQARRCMRQVERELKSEPTATWQHVPRAASAPGAQAARAASPQQSRSKPVPVPVHLHECVEGEPCEPWLYYAAAAAQAQEKRSK